MARADFRRLQSARGTRVTIIVALALLAGGLALPQHAAPGAAPATQPGIGAAPATPGTPATRPAGEGVVVVAKLVYAQGQHDVCFAEGFLALVERETQIKVRRRLVAVDLASPDLFGYPFAVMSGEGKFELTEPQRQNLKAYLQRGGLILASAGCSSAAWAASFRAELARVFPEAKVAALAMDHPIFHRLYDIERVQARKEGGDPVIYGLELGGRLAVVYSPLGLNDTANAGAGCCCCGGNEIRNAQQINANVLAYALTR